MIGIHPVHRRLAELYLISRKRELTNFEAAELHHCLAANANIVRKLDELKQLAFVAHQAGDMEWEQEICAEIDEIEATMI